MLDTIKTRWQASTATAKAWFGVGLAALAIAMTGAGYWLMRDDYQVLFTDLSAQDAGAMVTELDRLKVPYRIADNGATVLVDRDLVHKTRLKLMSKGFDLHGNVGLEIFNNADFGMTEFMQKVNYQRALQGELARTIGAFDEVKSARVHLVLPESGLFKRSGAKPKASISLIMKDNAQLAPEQIAGIQRLVAASIPEITPSAVTVLDQRGVALSGQSGDNEVEEAAAGRLDTKKRIEDYLTRKIVGVLDRAIGPGKAIVSVAAEINYDQVKVTKEDIVPLANTAGQEVGAITRRRESSQGGDPFAEQATAGLRGASAKTQWAAPAGASSVETEFATGRRVENVVSMPGSLRRLSVGVLVPGMTDPVELAKLKEVVTMAVGVDAGRGDAIAVYSVAPNGQPTAAQATSAAAPLATTQRRATANAFPGWATPLGAVLIAALLSAVVWQRAAAGQRRSPQRLTAEEREGIMREVAQWATSQRT